MIRGCHFRITTMHAQEEQEADMSAVSDHSRPKTIPVDRDGLRSGVVGHDPGSHSLLNHYTHPHTLFFP